MSAAKRRLLVSRLSIKQQRKGVETMPNWCMNVLTVSGPGHEEMVALWRAGNVFSAVAPQPETFTEAELADLEAYRQSTFPFPFPRRITQDDAWWSWRLIHWGTKWDVGDDVDVVVGDGATVIRFTTAWSPPNPALRTMSSLYPNLRFNLRCCEPSWPYAAETLFESGEMVSDHYYEEGESYRRIAAECGCEDEEDEAEEDDDLDTGHATNWRREGF